ALHVAELRQVHHHRGPGDHGSRQGARTHQGRMDPRSPRRASLALPAMRVLITLKGIVMHIDLTEHDTIELAIIPTDGIAPLDDEYVERFWLPILGPSSVALIRAALRAFASRGAYVTVSTELLCES